MSKIASDKECSSCKGHAPLQCGQCQIALCKSCAEFGKATELSFFTNLPKELSHNQYCSICFVAKVIPGVQFYKRLMRQAKDIYILEKQPREALRVLKKSVKPLVVTDCSDRDETFLRLAFQAAELGFNSVIRAKVVSKKIRNFGYQKMVWQGTGVAADLDVKDV